MKDDTIIIIIMIIITTTILGLILYYYYYYYQYSREYVVVRVSVFCWIITTTRLLLVAVEYLVPGSLKLTEATR